MKRLLKEKGLKAALLFDHSGQDTNMFYLTGLHIEYSLLVIHVGKPDVLYVSKMEYERAKRDSKIRTVRLLPKTLKLPKKVGVDGKSMTLFYSKLLRKRFKTSFVDVSEIFIKKRIIKQPDEIRKIKKSYAIADGIMTRALRKRFSSEKQILDFLAQETLKAGAEFSFEPTISSGKHASMPHHLPSNRLNRGFCIIDYGVRLDGYCSDITRTMPVGRLTKKEKELYHLLLDVQTQAIASLKEGVKLSDVDSTVRKGLGKYSKYFIHGLGHGVGLDIHESPSLGPGSKDILRKGMVFTVEPGIYIPGKLGIRIEDGIYFDGKARVLSRTRK